MMPNMMGIFSILPYYLKLGYGVWKIENSCKSKNTGVVKSLKEIKKKQELNAITFKEIIISLWLMFLMI